ncbi:hypothetical protein C1645_870771 [Glomus cerebriforme]|uniref:Uncharacterized protein n=1 Tax=Glomus cerebriforme TaxID=658196 RepID=A0A397TP70_9GLOM|nr:hypothetical protein C1645_870771 [Glomus cerebriforme]
MIVYPLILTLKIGFIMSQNDEKIYSMWCSKLDLAGHRLLAIERQEGSQEVRRIEIVIDEEVSFEKYLKFSESESEISVKCRLIGGKIEAYEIPINPHALLQAKLIFIVDNWNDQFLAILGSRPVNSSGQPYPTLVVEIGNMESLKSLHNMVEGYFSAPNIITGVGFGGVPCNVVNIQEYQMDIPTDLLFDSVNIPANTPANFNIDLFKLQNELARAI